MSEIDDKLEKYNEVHDLFKAKREELIAFTEFGDRTDIDKYNDEFMEKATVVQELANEFFKLGNELFIEE